MLVSVVARNNRQRRKDCKTYEETVHTCSKFRWDKKHRVAKGSKEIKKGNSLQQPIMDTWPEAENECGYTWVRD